MTEVEKINKLIEMEKAKLIDEHGKYVYLGNFPQNLEENENDYIRRTRKKSIEE